MKTLILLLIGLQSLGLALTLRFIGWLLNKIRLGDQDEI